ncbi:hypothetical protein HRG_008179 [Hirsutella rhossiliensis]|uniref:Uncharacterized protein n=1 Tax=Hirsutella rhossiliensis TaxID=111463 RepID=A0A9P8SHH3_9HYPO|nr:uncharacterized protein HRG_08179 [Hirsutella rhossiliensis]KAH0961026.1 hypothetical protein HRG_08179 [Hirsutella rhossiliensis]
MKYAIVALAALTGLASAQPPQQRDSISRRADFDIEKWCKPKGLNGDDCYAESLCLAMAAGDGRYEDCYKWVPENYRRRDSPSTSEILPQCTRLKIAEEDCYAEAVCRESLSLTKCLDWLPQKYRRPARLTPAPASRNDTETAPVGKCMLPEATLEICGGDKERYCEAITAHTYPTEEDRQAAKDKCIEWS